MRRVNPPQSKKNPFGNTPFRPLKRPNQSKTLKQKHAEKKANQIQQSDQQRTVEEHSFLDKTRNVLKNTQSHQTPSTANHDTCTGALATPSTINLRNCNASTTLKSVGVTRKRRSTNVLQASETPMVVSKKGATFDKQRSQNKACKSKNSDVGPKKLKF